MSNCQCEELAQGQIALSNVCLGQLWLFEDLDAADQAALTQAARRRVYQPGQAVFRQGDPAQTLFLIKGGRVKLAKLGQDGAEIILDFRKAGDFLGENMLNDAGALPVSAVAVEPTLTCGFSRQGFERLVLERPRLGLQVIKNLSRRIDWLSSQVDSLAQVSLEQRLYQALQNVAREHGRPTGGGLAIEMPLTHEELGFLVGAHRVSITRALKSLRQAGKVLQDGRRLIVAEA